MNEYNEDIVNHVEQFLIDSGFELWATVRDDKIVDRRYHRGDVSVTIMVDESPE